MTCRSSITRLRFLITYVGGLLGNAVLLGTTQQAFGKPSPSFLTVCLNHTSQQQVLANVVSKNSSKEAKLDLEKATYGYLLEESISRLSCVKAIAAEHCSSFYSPHAALTFYSLHFICLIVDQLFKHNKIFSAITKLSFLCVCVFVSFDTVQRNRHDLLDVIVGMAVGVVSGKYVLLMFGAKLESIKTEMVDEQIVVFP